MAQIKQNKDSFYKRGDYIIINKIFDNSSSGQWVETKEKIAKIESFTKTPTFGYMYTVSIDGKILKVMYTKNDIIKKYNEDPDNIWKMWGDI